MAQSKQNKLFKLFKKCNPEMAEMVVDYKPWGSNSLCLWLRNGMMYKVKFFADGKFVMQTVTEEDVKRKYGGEE